MSRKVPELRFPEFGGEWEEVVLGGCIKFKRNYSFSRATEGEGRYKHIHYGDIHTALPTLIKDTEVIPNIKAEETLTLVEDGDVLVADASEDYKDLGKTVVIKFENANVVAGSHVHAFSFTDTTNPVFYAYYTKTSKYHRYMRMYGTGVSVLGLSKNNLSKIYISVPSVQEQEKIAEFFSLLDLRIEKQKEKIEQLKQLKKGLIQKIFSQEIRFKDEDGNDFPEWEEVKLKEITTLLDYGMNTAAIEYDGENKYIRITDIDESSNNYLQDEIVSPADKVSNRYKLIESDLLFARTGASTGKSYYYKKSDGNVYFAGFLIRARISKDYCHKFVFYQTLRSEYKQWVSVMSMRSGQPGINAREYGELVLSMTILNEQRKISKFFSLLDKRIAKQQEKIEQLKQLKKGLIQKIFV